MIVYRHLPPRRFAQPAPNCEAFLFRAESDVLTAKFAVSMRDRSEPEMQMHLKHFQRQTQQHVSHSAASFCSSHKRVQNAESQNVNKSEGSMPTGGQMLCWSICFLRFAQPALVMGDVQTEELAQMYADTEARLNALKEKVSSKEGNVEKMQQEIDALGGGSAPA